MPPKFKFTKDEIISTALEITRKKGASALTARYLAEKLGSSSKPIFGLFQNMEEVQREVINAASRLYYEYLSNEIKSEKYPPYKASGMGYIRFAKEEKELFKLLFMRNRKEDEAQENREEIRDQLNLIMNELCITEDEAYILHLEMWIFVHGIATMVATDFLNWEFDFISNALTDAYQGLKQKYKKHEVV